MLKIITLKVVNHVNFTDQKRRKSLYKQIVSSSCDVDFAERAKLSLDIAIPFSFESKRASAHSIVTPTHAVPLVLARVWRARVQSFFTFIPFEPLRKTWVNISGLPLNIELDDSIYPRAIRSIWSCLYFLKRFFFCWNGCNSCECRL